MQGLGGLAPGLKRGATMSGNKNDGSALPSMPSVKFDKLGAIGTATQPTYIFAAPVAGIYEFLAIGGGGILADSTSAGGGSLGIIRKYLTRGASVSMLLGNGYDDTVNNTVITFPDGSTATAGGGKDKIHGSGGGVATGFDISVPGGNGGSGVPAGGAAGAYGDLGGGAHPAPGHGSSNNGTGVAGYPMPGRVTITYVGA